MLKIIRRVSRCTHTVLLAKDFADVLDDLDDHPKSLDQLKGDLKKHFPPVWSIGSFLLRLMGCRGRPG